MDHLAAWRRIAVAAVCGLVAAGLSFVLKLRADNPGAEPAGQNWWFVCWFVMAGAYGTAGAALLFWPARRRLAIWFLVVAATALLTAVSVQYQGFVVANGGRPPWPRLADLHDWTRPVMAGVLAALVPWELLPRTWRDHRAARVLQLVAAVSLIVVIAVEALDGPSGVTRVATWVLCIVATIATAAVVVRWWREQRTTRDPLPAWLAAGTVVAWLAVVPDATDLASWRLPGRDVVTAMLFVATVPLLVAGVLLELVRRSSSGRERAAHRAVEWITLTASILVVYTALVAGLGQLVGGSGPTWFLVAATGAIALALEPARRYIHRLADRLVYGSRDDPLSLVQRIVDHVGSGSDDLLAPLANDLMRELRVDAVAIDVALPDEWQRVVSVGAPTTHHRDVLLRHRDQVVGRLVVGWEHGPPLRQRDELVLTSLTGPMTLAVRWMQLANELRRSSVAIVVAREEERRRLRRDLHDGIGPTLTGISLGLRTSVRRLARSPATEEVRSAQRLLERLADEVDNVVVELKQIIRNLRPTVLDQLGLLGAVTEFARQFDEDLDIQLDLPPDPLQLPAAVEVATYRIVTEAVTNVVRHAGAERCWLTITTATPNGTVDIDVVDDGVGIGDAVASGVGLAAMRERAAELGGQVELRPLLPHGTHLHVELPAAVG